jgi:hypothetical protein
MISLVTRLALIGQRRVDAIEEHDGHRAAGAPLGTVAVLAGRERGGTSDDRSESTENRSIRCSLPSS